MSLVLGSAPQPLTVILVRHADFVHTLRRKDGTSWPGNAELVLEFKVADGDPESWAATLTGTTATWDKDAADVDALIAKRVRTISLWYIEGELKVLWAQGDPDIQGG